MGPLRKVFGNANYSNTEKATQAAGEAGERGRGRKTKRSVENLVHRETIEIWREQGHKKRHSTWHVF